MVKWLRQRTHSREAVGLNPTTVYWKKCKQSWIFQRKHKFKLVNMGKGQNYENHNVENQKELQKLRRRSEHRKD